MEFDVLLAVKLSFISLQVLGATRRHRPPLHTEVLPYRRTIGSRQTAAVYRMVRVGGVP